MKAALILTAIIGAIVFGLFALGASLMPAAVTPAKPKMDSGIALAATYANFIQYCPADFNAMTPQQRDAVQVFILQQIDKFGMDVIKPAIAENYRNDYYQLGAKWCPIARSSAKSIANSMTR